MEILQRSKEFTAREQHKLTKSKTAQSVREVVGVNLNVQMWALYVDTNVKGEDVEVLAMMDADGQVYTTISEVFKRSFMGIVEDFKDEDFPEIVILEGTTKAGRSYVDCDIA